MMAKKMNRNKTGHTYYRTNSKEAAHEVFNAMKDKKKIPKLDFPKNLIKDEKYANMSMTKFLNKYPEWKP